MTVEELDPEENGEPPENSQTRSKRTATWLFLIFVVVFGILTWLIFAQNEQLVGRTIAVLGVAAALLAFLVAPASLRSHAAPIGAALVLVIAVTVGWQLFNYVQTADKTREVKFVAVGRPAGTYAALTDNNSGADLTDATTATLSAPAATSSGHKSLELTVSVSDSPIKRSVQDCGGESTTSVDLTVSGEPPKKLNPGVPMRIPITKETGINGVLTMHTARDCVMRVLVTKAEYKWGGLL